jgi:hypothetical protein
MNRAAAALLAVLLAGLAAPAAAEVLRTRYGDLLIDEDNLLIFRDRPVEPRLQGNNFLSFLSVFEFPGYDLVLVQDTGGSACPASFSVVRVDARGAAASRSFGTCSDLINVRRTAGGLAVTMPGFIGPSAPRPAHVRASRQRFRYSYANMRVVETRIR